MKLIPHKKASWFGSLAGTCLLCTLTLALSALIFSCSDSNIERIDSEEGDATDNAISLYIDMGAKFETRAGEERYESYVNNLKILFFDKSGQFLFQPVLSENDITEEEYIENEEYRTRLKATVQIGGLTDGANENPVSLANDIRLKLRSENFKIAILANWPSTISVSWGYNESALKDGNQTVKNLQDLHSLTPGNKPPCTEWVKDEKWVIPDQTNGIPMFGIEDINAFINWANGETKDLSNQMISLIRSVAKVDLRFSSQLAEIKIHRINSKANCEPVDVYTSTSKSWVQNHIDDNCEWFAIQKHGIWEGESEESYDTWKQWNYGSWPKITTSETNNPKIFHPHVDTPTVSCNIAYNGNVNGVERYLIYIPEQNIANPDANYIPQVPYIEYRYENENKYYRIYFTNYSDNEGIKGISSIDGYNSYEGNRENLAMHWPVMRNHTYIFKVNRKPQDTGADKYIEEVINVRINPWEYEGQEDVVW